MLYLEIFEKDYIDKSPVGSLVFPKDLNYLKKLYNFNADQIRNYYESRNFAVKNTNFVSRIIEHIAPHLGYDIFRYISYIDNKLVYLGKHFKLTSDIEKGIVHYDNFFYNSTEFIFALNEIDNVKDIEKNWKKAKAISFIKCDRTNTKLLLPISKNDSDKTYFHSIAINLHILAIKYREFIREQLNKDIQLNKNHFVIKYVLNNTIEDIIDFMLLNRIINKFYNRENEVVKFKHPFKLFEPLNQIDRYVDDTLDVITNKKIDFLNILFNIHLIFKINAADLLILPDFIGSRQSRLALVLSRIDYMLFLYDVAKDKGRSRIFINDWKRLAKRIENDNFDQYSLDENLIKEYKEKIYKLKNL